MEPTRETLAYIAGLFDGEGCCYLETYKASKNGKLYRRLVAKITNTDRRALTFVQSIFGRAIATNGRPLSGRKQGWYWAVRGRPAENFLRSIRPWLQIKGEKVDILVG